jgi:hypothetical protein
MRRALMLSLLALSIAACKKQQPPAPTPAATPAPAPAGPALSDLTWKTPPAMFRGTRTSDAKGTFRAPVRVTNGSTATLTIDKLRLGLFGRDDSEVCAGTTAHPDPIAPGATVELLVEAPCFYHELAGDVIDGRLTGSLKLDGASKTLRKKTKIKFLR